MNSEQTYDYLIAHSGIIGRQILRLAKGMLADNGAPLKEKKGLAGFWQQKVRHSRRMVVRLFSLLVITFYTYYIGGSLTRQDQQTFARLKGLNGKAYQLTLYNALFCGLPTAAGYFLLGEGFSLLQGLHSLAELPSLIAHRASFGIGLASLVVDLFRLVDAAWNKRCWAPFGIFPMVINLPTYLKRLITYLWPANPDPPLSKAQTKKS
jgi:hypothetical protein